MQNRFLAACGALLVAAGSAFCQAAEPAAAATARPLSLTVTPSLDIPLFADAGLYNLGFGARVQADYRLPSLPLLFVGANL